MFFGLALATVALILLDAGWTKRSIMQVINGEAPSATVTGSPASMPLEGQPFKDWIKGRIDEGVDLTAKRPGEPLPALFGTSRVIGVIPNWYMGQPFVWCEVLDGPFKGHYYYYAEQVTNIKPVGSVVPRGQPVAIYASHGTGVEAGFATKDGRTLAKATTGYVEGQVTPAGTQFSKAVGL